jgi:hypothetical protein
LGYYYKSIPEPSEVQVRTNEYRSDNNLLHAWLNENVVKDENGVLALKDICYLFTGKNADNHAKNKIKKEVEKWIKTTHTDIKWQYQDTRFNNEKYRGWRHFSLSD